MRFLSLVALCWLLFGGALNAQPGDSPPYHNLPYTLADTPRQTLDIDLPDIPPPYPTLLLIHGGGFQFGDKRLWQPWVQHFTERGYAVVSLNYRFSAQASYPAQVEDVFCALAWLENHAATYGLDLTRLVAVGESAGGYLALALGLIDDPAPFMAGCPQEFTNLPRLRGAAAFYPMTGLALDEYPLLSIWALYSFAGVETGRFESLAARWRADLSPLRWIDADESPLLLVHGADDAVIPVEDTERLAAALTDAGQPPALRLIGGANHGFVTHLSQPDGAAGLRAFERWLAQLNF